MELTLPDLSRVSRIYADSGEVLDELHDGRNSEPVPFESVPEIVVSAILAAEDSDYFQHEGVDFSAIASAALDNLIYDSTRGGSTITQQVVKNAFVGSELTVRRKVNEAFVSAELERRFSKERILEFYMNSVYFGSGAYGVQTAAVEFFSKDMDKLSIHEAAALAVLVRNPSLYNPRRRPEITLARRNDVIAQMEEEGWISETEALRATREPLGVIDSPLRRGEADHVVAEVKRQLLNNDRFSFLGNSNDHGDVVIVSHQDPIQAGRLQLVGSPLSEFHNDKPGNGAIVTLRPGSVWREEAMWHPGDSPRFGEKSDLRVVTAGDGPSYPTSA
ncbi:MAG: transglycosylase domain-containing protein, partial [Acidimicrobiia bacterium]